MFGTFVFVWATLLTVMAALLVYVALLGKKLPDDHWPKKNSIHFELSKHAFTIKLNITKNPWRDVRYAVYALIAQCLNLYIMYN